MQYAIGVVWFSMPPLIKNNCLGAEVMAQLVKHLPPNSEELSLNPQNPC